MDEVVKAAMAKWPNVPHAYGWVRLDARGAWHIKDSRVDNPAISDFIGRNYDHDAAGRWFFQNGPQRVYVELDAAPWVLSFFADGRCVTHTGAVVTEVLAAWQDKQGRLCVETNLGPGCVDDRALAQVSMVIEEDGETLWLNWQGKRHEIGASSPAHVHFVAKPAPAVGEPEC